MMNVRTVAILGGSGFVGTHLARLLAARGLECLVPTRNRERAKRDLLVLPSVSLVETSLGDDDGLDRAIAGADVVVNLIGILHESGRHSFGQVHADLPARVVAACKRAGVRRYLHMSALCADPRGPSHYLRSKGEGEANAMAGHGDALAVTVFRPSVIFGRGDSFLTMFAGMLRLAPFVPLGSPQARFQPVWVEDVVRAFADALVNPATFGQRYDLCGPTVYSLRELLQLTGRAIGHRRPIIGLGPAASWLQAWLMELSPVKILTRDNVRSMSVPNVCGCGWPEVFDFQPAALEVVLPAYLAAGGRPAYDDYRARAGR